MGKRPIIGAFGAPILAATMLGLVPAAAIAAPDAPYHPSVLWATSEEKGGGGAPHGTTLAAQLHAHSDLTIRTFDDANLAEAVAKGELRTRSDTKLLHNLPPINLLGGCAAHGTKAHE